MLEAIKNLGSAKEMIPDIFKELELFFEEGAPIIDKVHALGILLDRTQDILLDEKDKRRNYAYKVRDMRKKQNEYFKEAGQKEKNFAIMGRLKKESKQYESEVDQKTIEIIQGVEQPKIFGE